MHTYIARCLGLVCVIAALYIDGVFGEYKGIKKDFRKSNKIAHFMGKRTNPELDGFMEGYMNDVDSGIPFRGAEGVGYPVYPARPIVGSEESYPYRRASEVKVAHIFGRHTDDNVEDGTYPYPYLVNEKSSLDRPTMDLNTLVDYLREVDSEMGRRIIDYVDYLLRQSSAAQRERK